MIDPYLYYCLRHFKLHKLGQLPQNGGFPAFAGWSFVGPLRRHDQQLHAAYLRLQRHILAYYSTDKYQEKDYYQICSLYPSKELSRLNYKDHISSEKSAEPNIGLLVKLCTVMIGFAGISIILILKTPAKLYRYEQSILVLCPSMNLKKGFICLWRYYLPSLSLNHGK